MVASKKFTQNWTILIILKLLIRVYIFVDKNISEIYKLAHDNREILLMKIYYDHYYLFQDGDTWQRDLCYL